MVIFWTIMVVFKGEYLKYYSQKQSLFIYSLTQQIFLNDLNVLNTVGYCFQWKEMCIGKCFLTFLNLDGSVSYHSFYEHINSMTIIFKWKKLWHSPLIIPGMQIPNWISWIHLEFCFSHPQKDKSVHPDLSDNSGSEKK